MDKILIATDFSHAGNNAVNYGTDLARHFAAEILLVNTFAPPLGGYDSMAPLNIIGEMQASSLANLYKLRDQMLKRTGYDPGIRCVSSVGSTVDLIKEMVAEHGVDLVVAGVVGEAGPVKKHLIGSTGLALARNLDVPLLIVPEDALYKPVKKITFACDMNSVEESTVIYQARYFSQLFAASMKIVSIAGQNEKEVSASALNFTENALQEIKHNTIIIHSEDPAEALAHYLSNHPTDMVLLNPKEHNIFKRVFSPGITQKLAFQLHTPMLLIR